MMTPFAVSGVAIGTFDMFIPLLDAEEQQTSTVSANDPLLSAMTSCRPPP